MLAEAAAKFDGKVKYVYCDIDKFPQVAQMLEISTIPQTYMIYQGDLVDEFGGVPKDMAAVEAFFAKAQEVGTYEKPPKEDHPTSEEQPQGNIVFQ